MRSSEVEALAERIRARARHCDELAGELVDVLAAPELERDRETLRAGDERVDWLRARRDAFYDAAELVAVAGELEAALERASVVDA